jgi:Fe-S-cluster containining protein
MPTDPLTLPVVSCDGCGRCCERVGTPPGFYGAYCSPDWDGMFLADAEDHDHWQAIPAELRRELADYYAAVDRGDTPDRSEAGDLPCLWYDAAAKRCRHHEHRPAVCREFEVGGEDCLRFREDRHYAN